MSRSRCWIPAGTRPRAAEDLDTGKRPRSSPRLFAANDSDHGTSGQDLEALHAGLLFLHLKRRSIFTHYILSVLEPYSHAPTRSGIPCAKTSGSNNDLEATCTNRHCHSRTDFAFISIRPDTLYCCYFFLYVPDTRVSSFRNCTLPTTLLTLGYSDLQLLSTSTTSTIVYSPPI